MVSAEADQRVLVRDLVQVLVDEVVAHLGAGLVVVLEDLVDELGLPHLDERHQLLEVLHVAVQDLLVALVAVNTEVLQEAEALHEHLRYLVAFVVPCLPAQKMKALAQQLDHQSVHVQVSHHELPTHLHIQEISAVISLLLFVPVLELLLQLCLILNAEQQVQLLKFAQGLVDVLQCRLRACYLLLVLLVRCLDEPHLALLAQKREFLHFLLQCLEYLCIN